MSNFKWSHKTIIEQYDYMNLVEEMTEAMWDLFIKENSDTRDEYIVYDLQYGDTLTQKGEDVFADFEEKVDKLIKQRLRLEYHSKDREWRSREEFLRKPF